MKNDHNFYMEKCLELAIKAKRNGRAGVGSIVLSEDKIVGEGIEGGSELPAHMAHAELIAINQAIQALAKTDLSGCVLYTTVEPCVMCSYVIRSTKIQSVVIGTTTGGVGGISSAYPILIAEDLHPWGRSPDIVKGVLEGKCQAAV